MSLGYWIHFTLTLRIYFIYEKEYLWNCNSEETTGYQILNTFYMPGIQFCTFYVCLHLTLSQSCNVYYPYFTD